MKKYLLVIILFITFTAKAITVQEFINAQAIIDSFKIRGTPPEETEKQSMLILKNLMNARVSGIIEGVLSANQMYEAKTGIKILCAGSIDTDELIKDLTFIWDNSSPEKRRSISAANLSTFISIYLEKKYKCPSS